MATVLTVISDPDIQSQVDEALNRREEWNLIASSPRNAKQTLEAEAIDVAVISMEPDERGELRLFAWIRNQFPTIPIVLLTADDTADEATVEALVLGAASYVPQSLVASNLAVTVERILSLHGCRRRHTRLLDGLHTSESAYEIVDNDLAMVPVIVGHLADTAEEFQVCWNSRRLQFSIALEEAFSNGILHGNLAIESASVAESGSTRFEEAERRRRRSPYSERILKVSAQFEPGIAQVTVADDGDGFDLASVSDPTRTVNLDKPYGRGLLLIHTFMDEVDFNEEGNQIRMTKRNQEFQS
jgi:DNA-binding response OmpR family regulator